MEGISEDLIEEILVRLPVKSLLRFKRVCRSWRALIQSRRFIHRHYCHDNNQERLLFPWGQYVEGRFEKSGYSPLWLDYFRENKHHRTGPVYGLLCEVSFSGHIVLLNPATHKVKEIPPLPFLITQDVVTHLCSGFGVESPSGDYKIVVFDTRSAFAWVYNSISDCWKSIEGVFSWGIQSGSRELDAKFWNGVYYWMLMPKDGADVILAFDMMTEKFRKFEAPPVSIAISAYGDSIAVMSGLGGGGDCVVWVMGKEGMWSEGWRFRGTQERLLGLCVWKGEVLFWDDEDDNVVVVDVTTKKVRILASGYPRQFDHPLCYKEGLLSIKGEQVARVFQDQGNLFLRI